MKLTIIGYSIYLFLSITIIIKVGRECHKNGEIFIADLIPYDMEYGSKVNNLLLIGYYLLNIGYTITTLSNINNTNSVLQLTDLIINRLAIIIFILAILHYFNLFWITKFIKKLNNYKY